MATAASSLPLDDPRVIQAVREYLAALEVGKKPDRHSFQARYRDIAAPLAECLDALEFMHAASPFAAPQESAAKDESGSILPQGIPLGDYRILREAGRGGMGVVYEAEQMSLGRHVALKVLPFASALDTRQLQRFRNEAQAAAHLHHQNIVPVYAVGCERGVHYYAMQFIEGRTLASMIAELRTWAGLESESEPGPKPPSDEPSPPKELRFTVREATPQSSTAPFKPVTSSSQDTPTANLSTDHSNKNRSFFRMAVNLAAQAAQGLEHAHQLGVVHRDIKPTNLLVDVRGNLWITDFGLAQIQGDNKLTLTGDLLGTLRYMSPEQALAQRVTVDQRTDIYSLGVTLYELLTLEPACNGPDRQSVLRQIAFEDPPHPRKLNRAISVDLETIVLKAIAKNPAERYATAKDLGEDLERYLRDEPVRAKRPTLTQKARKWAVRHQPLMWSGLVLLLVVLAGLTVSNILLRKQQETILDQKEELLQRKGELERERDAKAKAAAQAQLINKFLTDFLSEAAPDETARDKRVTAEELFRKAYQKITSEPQFTEDPEVEAFLRLTMGDTFHKLGALPEAETNLRKAADLRRRALGPDSLDTLATQEKLADFLNRALHRPDEAEPISRETWLARRRVLGPEHPDTLDSMDTYALSLKGQKKLADAERVAREGCDICREALGKDHERTLTSENNLATILIDAGKWAQAEEIVRRCYDVRRKKLGLEKVETLGCLNNLALALYFLGQLDEAEDLLRKGAEAMQIAHGKDFIYTVHLQYVLARVLLDKKSYKEAEELGRSTLERRRKIFAPGHEFIGRSLAVLGRILAEQGKTAEAEPLLQEASTLYQATCPNKKELIADAENWRGVCLVARNLFEDAEQLLVPSYKILKADPAVPERHKDMARQHILQLYEAWGKPEKAVPYRAKPAKS